MFETHSHEWVFHFTFLFTKKCSVSELGANILANEKYAKVFLTPVPEIHSYSNPKKEAPSAGSYGIWLYAFKLWYLQAAG